ncbi:(d)CMP kinase [Georgenia sp. Z1491]|uniref:(d)CMP kinase n=1 Tax=Georgenia sp. Z1491 TaxID=3416707 RepID=UPI003CED8110
MTTDDIPTTPAQRWPDLPGRGAGLLLAIDGPAGSGKSTVARRVAGSLGLAYLDTGAMYRAATRWCLSGGLDLAEPDPAAVTARVATMPLTMVLDPERPRTLLDGEDVSQAIRTPELTRRVAAVASNLDVRADLLRRQRAIVVDETTPGRASVSAGRGVVAEGRDVTTVLATDADVRLLLTASEEARLARRAREVRGSSDAEAVAATRAEVLDRDTTDSATTSFLTAADGVTTLDTSDLDLPEVVAAVRELVASTKGHR